MRYHPDIRHHQEIVLDIYKLAAAAFLFVTPWLFAFRDGIGARDLWISSALIIALSLAAVIAFADWEEWLSLLLGFWLLVSPWVLNFVHPAATHVSVGVGLVIVYLSALELWVVHYAPDVVGHEAERHPK